MNETNSTGILRPTRREALAILTKTALGATLAAPIFPAFALPLDGEMTKYKPSADPQPIPEIEFQDKDDRPRSLKEWSGKLIILNFWATWCAPCIKEMPSLDRLGATLDPSKAVVLAISQDRAGRQKAQEFYDKIGMKHLPLLIDKTMKSARAFKTPGLPTTVFISPDGRVLGQLAGTAEWDEAPAKALIAHYLKI
ncbi:TlpA family protein disulfide reductase [Lacibacterium aquatile]|uniref:TlpA family protein disulfide reductase n=1 Tax=Lacibacterium aquatile TaxID=1168082 RepID=A0ABW5DV27_9PROT